MKTVVCLVSHQPMANVIPVLELNPDKVILLRTKQESKIAENLQKLFVKKNIKTEINAKYIDPYNLETVKTVCRQIINDNKSNVILNVTGGTKPMAIAAYEIFKSSDKKIVYYDPINHYIMMMNPMDSEKIPIINGVNVEDYLTAHGYKITSEMSGTGRAEQKEKFLNGMNYKRFNEFMTFYSEVKSKNPLNKLRFDYTGHGFKFNKGMDRIKFIDEATKEKIKLGLQGFCFGDFLEDLLYLKLKNLKHDDIKYSVKISKEEVKSEVDVLMTNGCKLYLYSCKDKAKTDKYDLFEIEVLRNIAGGTFGKANFVVTKDDEYIQRVANNLNISVKNIRQYFDKIYTVRNN